MEVWEKKGGGGGGVGDETHAAAASRLDGHSATCVRETIWRGATKGETARLKGEKEGA